VGSSATSLDPIDAKVNEADPATRRLAAIACASFLLIGWSGLLVPSLIRSVRADFGQTDAGLGLFYLVGAIFYAIGSFGGGLVTERVGRRFVLAGAAVLIGIGLALQATAPTWTLFMIAAAPAGLGSGVVDGGMNGLILDLFRRRPGGALNLLHLFFSLGAAGSPLIVGQLVGADFDWRTIVLGTAVAAVVIGLLLATQAMPTGRHVRTTAADTMGAAPDLRRPILPLILLALAIAFYVSSEIGVSSWLVRFLESASNDVATTTLAGFWGGLALGRLLASRVADRFRPVRFATACSLGAAVALLGAIAVPWLPVSIALFALSGFAFGPVYPMIMTIAGALYPRRLSAVTGGLAGSAVVGGIVYPPLMGFISVEAGIGVAMVGAGILALACTAALVGASVTARRMLGSTTG
jgi:fucose permease